jgi:uncharacterized membrane protein YtjA (UPF0391 family)
MLRWSLIFLVVALVAALFAFTPIAASAAGIAQILFWTFLVLFVVGFLSVLMIPTDFDDEEEKHQ